MQIICPFCHQSSADSDACSECGKVINADHTLSNLSTSSQTTDPNVTSQGSVSSSSELMECPVCSVPRAGLHARFCDNCRYDFVENKPYTGGSVLDNTIISTNPLSSIDPDNLGKSMADLDQTNLMLPQAATDLPAQPVVFETNAFLSWDLVVSVDPNGRGPDDQKATDLRDRIFPLDLDDNLIGRRSDKEGVHPEIELNDIGVTRKHARIIKRNGKTFVLDLRSTNGTFLDGKPLDPNVETEFDEKNTITMGCWTVLRLRLR